MDEQEIKEQEELKIGGPLIIWKWKIYWKKPINYLSRLKR